MPGLPYNLFLNATFAQSLSGFVGEDGGGYRLAPIRIGCPELKIGKFRRGHTQQRDIEGGSSRSFANDGTFGYVSSLLHLCRSERIAKLFTNTNI